MATITETRPAYTRTNPTIQQRTIPAMAKCPACKAAKRVAMNIWRAYAGYGRYTWAQEWPTLVCDCGTDRHPMVKAIQGTTTEKPCDARCTGAKGHVCECSCGGKNHGSGL